MTAVPAIARPVVAVGAIILSGDHVLLIERGVPPARGQWSVPGGKLELGETLAAAVEREVHEETGVRVACGPLVDVVERVIPADTAGAPPLHFVILDYLATIDGGDGGDGGDDGDGGAGGDARPVPVAGSDVTAARWVAWSELAALPLTTGLYPVLEKARGLVHQS